MNPLTLHPGVLVRIDVHNMCATAPYAIDSDEQQNLECVMLAVRRLPLVGLIFFTALVGFSPSAVSKSAQASRTDILRGDYGRYRANNDLLFYRLDVRVDPENKFISGKNAVRFRMLKDDSRIQLDLAANLNIDKILL